MADRVVWNDLLEIYLCTIWSSDNQASVSVANEDVLSILRAIDSSEDEIDRTGISIPSGLEDVVVGDLIEANIGYPKGSIGLVVDDWSAFVRRESVLLNEPAMYFIKQDSTHNPTDSPTPIQSNYRKVLAFLKLCTEAAVVTDTANGRIVFHNGSRVDLPLKITENSLKSVECGNIDSILSRFGDKIHEDKKLEILSDVVVRMISPVPLNKRMGYLLDNMAEILKGLDGGYQIFISNFSYNKIRGEVESAQSEYISKIHKTFTDIQGQVLGIPVAAFVVASQLKTATKCGPELWINIAVLAGAWIFVILLAMSCINQWFTLSATAGDIGRQAGRLNHDYSEISEQFSGAFKSLETRICWHKMGLLFIGGIGIIGALVASLAFYLLLPESRITNCVAQPNQASSATIWAAAGTN